MTASQTKELANSMTHRVCHVVAGPNGAGKSTFALRYLPDYAGSIEYVNPDLVAQGLSPTDIRLSAIKAGKLTLSRIGELIEAGEPFGFETTIAGRGHLKLLADAKARGYEIHLYYLWIPEEAMLPVRIRHRVLDGGHDVPRDDVMRRYERSRANLRDYMELANKVYVFDATRTSLSLVWRRNGEEVVLDPERTDILRKGGWL